tara:strand:+ start:601 stop:846 length:246 start_codon:yes stop_codon:yes gene_type:complete
MNVVRREVGVEVNIGDGKLMDVYAVSGEILRVELTRREFEEFVERKGIASWVSKRERRSPIGESGNYVVYNGLCIQTHERY